MKRSDKSRRREPTREPAVESGYCRKRSAYYDERLPHRFTSHTSVNGEPPDTHCCWCGSLPDERGVVT